jgi:hypothetical protein
VHYELQKQLLLLAYCGSRCRFDKIAINRSFAILLPKNGVDIVGSVLQYDSKSGFLVNPITGVLPWI